MKPEFWLDRWRSGKIGFHQDEAEPLLTRFFPQIGGPGRVFVPLCGKSLDMVWLAGQGHEVVGVELSELACESFFSENLAGREIAREARGAFTVFRSGPFTIYCGDFFELGAEELAGVTFVYDRAALIALPPGLRDRYVAHLDRLLKPGPRLLVTLEYPQERMQGPPFSIGAGEVARLYGELFEIEHCAARDASGDFADHPGLAGAKVLEHAFLMKGRS